MGSRHEMKLNKMSDERCNRQDFGPCDLHSLVLSPGLCDTPRTLYGKRGLSGCDYPNHMCPLKADSFVKLVAEKEVSKIGAHGEFIAGFEDGGGHQQRKYRPS